MLVAQPNMTNATKLPKNKKTDRTWIQPPNTIVRQGKGDAPQKLSYWTDTNGKAKLYTKEQLAVCNILMNLNLLLVKALLLLDTLKTMDEDAKVGTLVHQDYAKFEATKSSVFNHFITLMASVPEVTFGEFLNFLSTNTSPGALTKMGQKTLKEVIQGKSTNVTHFYTSDKLKE